jgi:hypothetical protein
MPVIKIHLDDEEFAPVARLADELHLRPEDIAYAGLNMAMARANDATVRTEITEAHYWRRENLPSWGDSARSVHAYEGKADGGHTQVR